MERTGARTPTPPLPATKGFTISPPSQQQLQIKKRKKNAGQAGKKTERDRRPFSTKSSTIGAFKDVYIR